MLSIPQYVICLVIMNNYTGKWYEVLSALIIRTHLLTLKYVKGVSFQQLQQISPGVFSRLRNVPANFLVYLRSFLLLSPGRSQFNCPGFRSRVGTRDPRSRGEVVFVVVVQRFIGSSEKL
jgi:hypothetical protein